jgi:hypothetical protein
MYVMFCFLIKVLKQKKQCFCKPNEEGVIDLFVVSSIFKVFNSMLLINKYLFEDLIIKLLNISKTSTHSYLLKADSF